MPSDAFLIDLAGRIAAATMGTDKVPMAGLARAVRAMPGWGELHPQTIGRTLRAAGWQPRQWRLAGGRVRGYAVPSVTTAGLEPARQAATRACSRPQP